jgi:hypothetical protein
MRSAFTRLWTNTVLLRYPCNMSDCSAAPPQAKRRTNMTIAEALQKAVEGGYQHDFKHREPGLWAGVLGLHAFSTIHVMTFSSIPRSGVLLVVR